MIASLPPPYRASTALADDSVRVVMEAIEPGLEEVRRAQDVSRIALAYAGPVEKAENLATVLADAVAIQEYVADPRRTPLSDRMKQPPEWRRPSLPA